MGSHEHRKATGRIHRHDPASRAYEAPRRILRPVSWLHRMGPVLDQADINGCVGWTWGDWLNAAIAVGNRKRYNTKVRQTFATRYLGNSDCLNLYELATQNDPFKWTYPPVDNGSSALGGAKALKSMGVIDEYLWTFDFTQCLAHGQREPVQLGTLWTDAMSDPDSKGIIHIGTPAQIKSAEDAGMGHEYTLRGVNWPRKLARIRNHWTPDWGLKGEALIPLDELETLVMAHQGDVMVPTLAVP